MSDNRDTQFAGFAARLLKEIDDAIAANDTPQHTNETAQELADRLGIIIARRAHDLVQHTIGYSLEYVHECGYLMSGGMGTRIAPTIPDLTTWPEEKK